LEYSQVTSSRKNGSYSASSALSYQPPRRESIEDHLTIARARVQMPGKGWTKKLASPRFVLDLIEHDIINGPAEVDKASGPGRGRRFLPRDYHELLEVIRFKALGASWRDAWIVRLWLRGHDYPFDTVKTSLIQELRSILGKVHADFAPTGRWTEPFPVKYDRRVRHPAQGEPHAELIDAMEPLAMLMTRPDLVHQLELNPDAFLPTLVEATGRSEDELRPLFDSMAESLKANRPPDPTAMAKINEIMRSQLPPNIVNQALKPDPSGLNEIDKLVTRMHGLYGDGATDPKIIRMLERATAEHFERARKLIRATLTGLIERAVRSILPTVPLEDRPLVEYCCSDAQRSRNKMRHNPWIMMQTLAQYVISFMPPEKAAARGRADATQTLNALKDLVSRGLLSF
jgi:hypothetical protein